MSVSEGNSVHLSHQCANFRQFDLHNKPASFVVHNGGWVVFEKANFKGKFLYHHDGDCFSNNPANPRGLRLKSWQTPIGSIRPIVGTDLSLLSVKLELDRSKVTKEMTTSSLETLECRNSTFQYVAPDWETAKTYEVSVSHR